MSVNSFDNYPLTWRPDRDTLEPPYYLSLANDLSKKIQTGLLKPGTKLPPQREIADYLNLNYTTITRVYEKCKQLGLIYGVTGKGTFVAQKDAGEIALPQMEPAGSWIELGSVNAFSEYNADVEDATRAVLNRDYLRTLFDYSSPTGHAHQRSAALRWMEQLGVHADIDHVAIFSGAQNALTVALLSLFHHGDRIAVDCYTYPNFIELAKMLGVELVPVGGDSNGMLADALDKLCCSSSLQGIFLMPSFANPTGTCMAPERREEIAEVIHRHNLILLEDDIGAWLPAASGEKNRSLFDLLGGNSIYICGMTKSLCSGLRIAYMCYGEKFKERILHGLFNINIKTSSLDAEIITEMILNGSAYQMAEHKLELTKKADQLFRSIFEDQEPLTGYFRWLNIRSDQPGTAVEKELLSKGVRIYHADRFAAQAKLKGDAHIRVSLCSAGSFQRLKKGLCILKENI